MCWFIPPRSPMPWLLYINSVLQSSSVYAMWIWYDSGYFVESGLPSIVEKKDG
jgi:hypothetical protein